VQTTDKAVVTRESHPGLFVQWCMFFCKEHPVLKELIQQTTHNILLCSFKHKYDNYLSEQYTQKKTMGN